MPMFIILLLLLLILVLLARWCLTLSRKGIVAVAAGLWLLYGIYESLVYARILCSGECNIRVDLLLIYPILLFVTGTAVARSIATPGAGS